MKVFYGSIVAMAALAFSGSVFATQITVGPPASGEPSLYEIADNSGFTNVNSGSPQSNGAYWRIGATNTSTSLLEATWTSNFANAEFGVFDPNDPSDILKLLGGGSQNGPSNSGVTAFLQYITVGSHAGEFGAFTTDSSLNQSQPIFADFGGDVFGFYLAIGGTTFYSDIALNGGDYRMVGYQGSGGAGQALLNEFLFGWEDGTDGDYQDYVVTIESIAQVPGPSSIAMLGIGLLMIGFSVRRMHKRDI